MAPLAATYLPRKPHDTVLYRLVKEHGSNFLQYARDMYDGPLPRYVEDELRGYLRCGDFSQGFVHLKCEACQHDLLVAFSCKSRGLCPSCAGRRMAAQAAHLVDAVVPAVPIRQYVLSFPFELSLLAATKPDVLRALARIFAEALAGHYRARAKEAGTTRKTYPGALTFVQRFGSSLNVHVHLHVCALDGVFVDDGGEGGACPRFVPAPPPTRTELAALLERVSARVTTWLRKHGHIRTDDELYASNDRPEPSFQEALALAGTQRGTLEKRRDDGEAEGDAADVRASAPKTDAVTHLGFNLHASVTIAANDDFGRERLFRYGLRPPFALSRMRMLSDGRVAYRVKKAGRGKASYRIMTPVECIARLCALVPPPRYPLTRFHGVLAPRSALRARVVPKLPTRAPACKVHASRKNEESPSPSPDPSPTPSGPTPSRRHEPVVPAAPPVGASALALALAIALPDAENPARRHIPANGRRLINATNDVDDDHRRSAKSQWSAEVEGFNVHAGVTVAARDRAGLPSSCCSARQGKQPDQFAAASVKVPRNVSPGAARRR